VQIARGSGDKGPPGTAKAAGTDPGRSPYHRRPDSGPGGPQDLAVYLRL
jgi:hypothetical protein